MRSFGLFLLAGLLEIGGGYLVWLWIRERKPIYFGVFGFLLLASYGLVPVLQPKIHPFGRVYAAYGAVFVILSMLWSWIEGQKTPDALDWIGAGVCVLGALLMMWPREA